MPEQLPLDTLRPSHEDTAAPLEPGPLEHNWYPFTQVTQDIVAVTREVATPRTEYSEVLPSPNVHEVSNRTARYHTDTPSAQLPRTPCRKRPVTGVEGYSGPARGTRSNTKRQKWSTSGLINVGEGYITPVKDI